MEKTNMIKFKTSNLPHQPLTIGYEQKYVKEITGIKVLGIRIDSCLTWKNHVQQVISKLSAACYAVRMMYHIMNTDTLRMIYFGYFHSVMEYEMIFWGNSASVDKVFKLQKRMVRIMAGVGSRCSCRGLLKRLDILPVPCQYIFSLTTFVADNVGSFQTNSFVHGLNTRNKTQLHRPFAILTRFKRGVSYAVVKILNSLPTSISNLRHDKKNNLSLLYKSIL
jgi:hypothetical protein